MLCVVPMKLRLPGERRPLTPEARAGLGAAFVLLALISAIDLADGATPNYIGLLASAPFLVATFAAWREVLIVGGLATAIGVAFGSYPHGLTMSSAVTVGFIMAVTAIAAVAGTVRAGQAERLAGLSRPASLPPAAVLRPLGARRRPRGAGRGAGWHPHDRQLRAPGPAAAAPRRGDPAGAAGERSAAGVHAGGTAAGGAAGARRPAAALPRRAGRGAPRGGVLPDRRAGVAAARPRHGRRRSSVPRERPGGVGTRAARRRHRPGPHGVRRCPAGHRGRRPELGSRHRHLIRCRASHRDLALSVVTSG